MEGTTSATKLFRALVADPRVAALEPMRGLANLDVRSVAVNGDRIDIVAGTPEREWRVVIGGDDITTAQSVHVFARRPYEGTPGGRVVVVNGPSSSGKSTLLRAIASRSALPWVTFDEPMFGTVDPSFLIWREDAPSLHAGFIDGIAAVARAGNRVALAAGGHPSSVFARAFEGVPTVYVGLDCTDDELQRRERGRDDVPGGLWAASPRIHDGWQYDLRFDSGTVGVDDIADEILRAID